MAIKSRLPRSSMFKEFFIALGHRTGHKERHHLEEELLGGLLCTEVK